jgi:hypothetical protein
MLMINAAVAIHPTRHTDRSRGVARVSGGASVAGGALAVSLSIWLNDWTLKARAQCTNGGAPLSFDIRRSMRRHD